MSRLTKSFSYAIIAFSSFAVICVFSCKKRVTTHNQLGNARMEVSGDAKALPHFEKGLLLLHSFEYADACEEFLIAQEIDPNFSMAYWGEAMTYNHCLWQTQDYERGVAALNRLELLQNQKDLSGIEKDFIRSVKILYEPDVPKVVRDKAYADFLSKMYEKYPGNKEVMAFYALSLLGSVPEGRDEIIYGKSAVVSKEILDENSDHPGALHYLIHAYDDPNHAYLALDAADSYSKVAPDASHALHMPSHIFVALGLWDKVVTSNEHSYQASLNRMARKHLGNDARGYHAYHWLEYGYLQLGHIGKAKKLLEDMEKFVEETPSVRGRKHLVFLKGTFLVETNLWDDPIADIVVDVSDMNVATRSQYRFLEGMKAYTNVDSEKIDRISQTLALDYKAEAQILQESDITVCRDLSGEEATQTNILESKVMEMQLRGLSAWLKNKTDETETWLTKSIELEDSLSYSYGPPFIQKPTHELYAEWLLTQQRYDEALKHFELALKRAPNRILALTGKKKAESLLKKGQPA